MLRLFFFHFAKKKTVYGNCLCAFANTFFLSYVCVAVFHVHVNVERELCLETTTYSWPQKQPLDKNTSQHKVHLCFKVRLWSFKHVLRPPDTMESICNRLLDLVLRIDGQFVSLFVQSDIKYFFPWCDDPIDFLFIFKVNDSRTLKISSLTSIACWCWCCGWIY